MYLITKLSQTTVNYMNGLGSTNASRSVPVTLSVARVIADSLSLPSSKVDSIHEFYSDSFLQEVNVTVSMINEIVVIDTNGVLDLVEKLYQARYSVAFGDVLPFLRSAETAVLDFFGISKTVEDGMSKVIAENAALINEAVLRFKQLIAEAKA